MLSSLRLPGSLSWTRSMQTLPHFPQYCWKQESALSRLIQRFVSSLCCWQRETASPRIISPPDRFRLLEVWSEWPSRWFLLRWVSVGVPWAVCLCQYMKPWAFEKKQTHKASSSSRECTPNPGLQTDPNPAVTAGSAAHTAKEKQK